MDQVAMSQTTDQAATSQTMRKGDRRVAAFHARAGKSHSEARKLLTGMAVGSVGVLYATLTGKDAPVLDGYGYWFAVSAIVSMALSTWFGLTAWSMDAAWAYEVAKNFQAHPDLVEPNGEPWHTRKRRCEGFQLGLFLAGFSLAALLALWLVS